MSIATGNDGIASDFITSSGGSGDSGKVPKLDSAGRLHGSFIRGGFGGDGSDGALSISSGTTTLNAAGARVLVKNYTSISITGTARLTISNKHANGTILILKSQGNMTITSSGSSIDLKGMGADGGAAGTNNGSVPSSLSFSTEPSSFGLGSPNAPNQSTPGSGVAGGLIFSGLYSTSAVFLWNMVKAIACGAGGGGAGAGAATGSSPSVGASGAGGAGGGALILECAGAPNFTGTIDVSGNNGGNGANASGNAACGGSGGGGGGGGMVLFLYNTTGTTTGTILAAGGNGGNGGNAVSTITSGGIAPACGGSGAGALGGAGAFSSGNGSTGDLNGPNGTSPGVNTSAGGSGGVGATTSSNTSRTGGTGGAGGTTYSGQYLITQNRYFA